ncbi:MAG TPA: HAD family hydrolase [Vicinamibacterales bacterium]|jgi:histidinol-phosphate phosphatase family protein
MALSKAVFLDRDGVINPDIGYPHQTVDAIPFPDVASALRRLQAAGYQLTVVSNQSGIARGYYTLEQAEAFNGTLAEHLRNGGVAIDHRHFFLCPHHPNDRCGCRKPKPGLILRAAQELNLSLPESFIVGDAETDIQAGHAAGLTTIRLNRSATAVVSEATSVLRNLHDVADWVLRSRAHASAFTGS